MTDPDPPLRDPLAPLRQGLATVGAAVSRAGAGPLAFAGFAFVSLWIWLPAGDAALPQAEGEGRDLATRLAAQEETLAALIPITGERPLFDATRRPLAAPEAPAPPPEAVLVLVGILGDGDQRIALVRQSTSADLYQLEPGGQLGPWQVLSVDIGAITVSKDGGPEYTLRLGE